MLVNDGQTHTFGTLYCTMRNKTSHCHLYGERYGILQETAMNISRNGIEINTGTPSPCFTLRCVPEKVGVIQKQYSCQK